MSSDPQWSEALTAALEGDGIVTNLYYYLWRYMHHVDVTARDEGGYTLYRDKKREPFAKNKPTTLEKINSSTAQALTPPTFRAQSGVLTQLALEMKGREEHIVISARAGAPRRIVTLNKQTKVGSHEVTTKTLNASPLASTAISSQSKQKTNRKRLAPQPSHAETLGITFPLLMPSTIIIEENYPKAWYNHMDDDDVTVPPARRLGKDIETSHILREFLAETKDADEMHTLLLQQQLSIAGGRHSYNSESPVGRRPTSGLDISSVAFGSGGGQQSLNATAAVDKLFADKYKNGQIVAAYFANTTFEGKHCVKVEYLDGYALRELLTKRSDRPSGFVQKWVPPCGPHNSVIQAVWAPTGCYFTRRLNKYDVADTRIPMYERALTFEGEAAAAHYCAETELAPHVRTYIKAVCSDFVSYMTHVHSIELKRLVLHFKVDYANQLWFLWASSSRTVSTELINIALRYVPSSAVDSQSLFNTTLLSSSSAHLSASTAKTSHYQSLMGSIAAGHATVGGEVGEAGVITNKPTRPRTGQATEALRHRKRYFSSSPMRGVSEEVFAMASINPLIGPQSALALSGLNEELRKSQQRLSPEMADGPSAGVASTDTNHRPTQPTPLNATDLKPSIAVPPSNSVLLGSPIASGLPVLGGVSPIPPSPSNLNLAHITDTPSSIMVPSTLSPREKSLSGRERALSLRKRGSSLISKSTSSFGGEGGIGLSSGAHTPHTTHLRGYSRRPKSTSVGPNGMRNGLVAVELPTIVHLPKDPITLWAHLRWAVRSGWHRDFASAGIMQEWLEGSLYHLYSLQSIEPTHVIGSPRLQRYRANTTLLNAWEKFTAAHQRPTDPSRLLSVPVGAIATLARAINKHKGAKQSAGRRTNFVSSCFSGGFDEPTIPTPLIQFEGFDGIPSSIQEDIGLAIAFLNRLGISLGLPMSFSNETNASEAIAQVALQNAADCDLLAPSAASDFCQGRDSYLTLPAGSGGESRRPSAIYGPSPPSPQAPLESPPRPTRQLRVDYDTLFGKHDQLSGDPPSILQNLKYQDFNGYLTLAFIGLSRPTAHLTMVSERHLNVEVIAPLKATLRWELVTRRWLGSKGILGHDALRPLVLDGSVGDLQTITIPY